MLLLFFFCADLARGEWRITSSETSGTGAAGLHHLTAIAEENGARATLHLAVFSNRTATLRVIDDPQASLSLVAVMQREKCIAGVNGGYFTPEHAPVGLLISDGRVIAPRQKARLLSGIVSVADGGVRIQRAAEFSLKTKPSAARQCGPFLIERGKAIAGLNDSKRARRTFVATLAGGRAALGHCSPVTLAQLAGLLAASNLQMQGALNLDGGSSSGFWFAGADGVFSIREQKTVRDYIGIVTK